MSVKFKRKLLLVSERPTQLNLREGLLLTVKGHVQFLRWTSTLETATANAYVYSSFVKNRWYAVSVAVNSHSIDLWSCACKTS